MKCPNCGKDMIKSSRKLSRSICVEWDQIDGESVYETQIGYKYTCPDCKIHYNSLYDVYTIPKKISVDITDKQKYCISIICQNLNMKVPYIINKKLASEFIDKYISKSKEISEKRRENYYRDYDYDDYDFDPYFHCDPYWGNI